MAVPKDFLLGLVIEAGRLTTLSGGPLLLTEPAIPLRRQPGRQEFLVGS